MTSCSRPSSRAVWIMIYIAGIYLIRTHAYRYDDSDVGDDVDDYNDYDENDDDDEFQYGDVYVFDDQIQPSSDKSKAKPDSGHFRSSKLPLAFPDQTIDEGFLLQDDHRQYSPEDVHPGAGVHNGHELMDKTHTNLVHDNRDGTQRFDEALSAVDEQALYRPVQARVRAQKVPAPAYRQPYHSAEDPTAVRHYDEEIPSTKPKPKRTPFGRGGIPRGEALDLAQFGPYQKAKPLFTKTAPVRDDPLLTYPEHYEKEQKEGGYHFSSSSKLSHS